MTLSALSPHTESVSGFSAVSAVSAALALDRARNVIGT